MAVRNGLLTGTLSVVLLCCSPAYAGQLQATQQLAGLQDQLDAAVLLKDVDAQISILEQLDRSGSEHAKYLLSILLIDSSRSNEEISRAREIISENLNSEDGDLKKIDMLIAYENEKSNRRSAFDKVIKLADEGYEPAVFLASQMYLVGDGIGLDSKKAYGFSEKISQSSRYAKWKIPRESTIRIGTGKALKNAPALTIEKLLRLRNGTATVFMSPKLLNKTKLYIDNVYSFSLGWDDTKIVITSPREVIYKISANWLSILDGCTDETISSDKNPGLFKFIGLPFGGAMHGCPQMVDFQKIPLAKYSVWLEDFSSFDDLIFWNDNDLERLHETLTEEKTSLSSEIYRKAKSGLDQEFKSIRSELDRIAREGDGSEDDLICKKITKVATAAYFACRSKLEDQRIARSKTLSVIPASRAAKSTARTGGQSLVSSDSPFGRVALSLKEAAIKCRLLGFKDGTEKFGKCVLQLSQ